MARIKISQGRIIDPDGAFDQISDLYIAEGHIAGLAQAPESYTADIEIDASGCVVCPGFVDLNARLCEPGYTRKADIKSETRAAARAGMTRLCVPPDTRPVVDTMAVVELIRDKARQAGFRQVYPIGALTQGLQGAELSAMFSLRQAGCLAVSNAQYPLNSLLVLHRAMQYAATHDLLLVYQPQEYSLSYQGCVHDGVMAAHYGLPCIPETAETIALAQCLELVRKNGCRVHFSQISSARSVELLRQAKDGGLPVSADVAMHQLHLCEQDMIPFDSAYHVNPPLRSAEDRQALRLAVREGVIDAICSAHQPHDIDAKLGAFPETEAGISALETVLPLMLRLVTENVLSLSRGLQLISSCPASVFGLSQGSLKPGSPADICIFDPHGNWRIDRHNWLSRGQNTPFWGQQMTGQVTHTLQSGKIIFSAQGV